MKILTKILIAVLILLNVCFANEPASQGELNYKLNAANLNFITEPSIPIKLEESFTGSTFPPSGWNAQHITGILNAGAWFRSTSGFKTSPACAQSNGGLLADNYLITKRFTPGLDDSLVFWVSSNYLLSNYGRLDVKVSTTDSLVTSFSDFTTPFQIDLQFLTPNVYVRKVISLSAYAEQSIFIAFRHIEITGSGGTVRIDDIVSGVNIDTQVSVTPNAITYPTLYSAFNAINAGTHGAGAITVTINGNTSESSSATLNGNTFASCLIKPSGVRIVSGNFNDAIIVLNGADNVTIDGLNTGGNSLTLTNTNTGINQGCIRLSNGAQNNVIKNLTCNGTGTASTGGKTIYVAESITAIGNNNNIIENNIINGGNRGIQTFGTSYLVTNDGTIIRNNIIKNIASIGIFIGSETRNNTVQGNKIYFDVFFTVDLEFRAINIQGVGTNQITTNKIFGISNNANHDLYGIISIPVILTAPGSSITTVNIVNNFISIANDNPFTRNIYGIRISSISAPYTANVYFNSVLISGNGSNVNSFTAGIIVNNSLNGSNTIVKNNIFRNNRSGGNSSAQHTGSLYIPYSGSSISADYNISIATDSIRGYNSGWNGSLYNEMNEYRQAACDPNINELHTVFWNKFSFVSSNDLHLIDSTIMGSFNATPIPGITTDIDGDLRKSDAPYRGADELQDTFIVLNLGVAIQGAAPPNASVITVQFFRNSPPYDVIAQSTEVIDQSRTSGGIVPVVMRFHPILLLLAFPPLFDVYTDGVIPVFGLCEESMGWLLGLLHCEKLQSAFQLEAEYDFTTSISKAYGNNQIMYAGLASLYNGDVNNDGVIDASDLALIDNDASDFLTGNYLVNDITRDGIVDGVDLSIADNNAYNFVAEISPIPQEFTIKDTMVKSFSKSNRSEIRTKFNVPIISIK